MELEKALDEQERVRAAEAIADWKLSRNWKIYNAALNPEVWSSMDFITRRAVRGTNAIQNLLREFWREKV
jgi:hypothetical protein